MQRVELFTRPRSEARIGTIAEAGGSRPLIGFAWLAGAAMMAGSSRSRRIRSSRERYLASDETLDIGALLDWGKEKLKAAGIDDYIVSAEILIRHALNLSRSELIISRGKKPSTSEINRYKQQVEQRTHRVPLQYITGTTEFYSVIIKCDRRALIPRPETEVLVETIIQKLKNEDTPSILDIGVGSGNIAVALAKNIKGSKVTGIEISPDALDLACENAALNGVSDSLRLIQGNIDDPDFMRSLGAFDCVVSNPPYVSEDDKESLMPEVREFEPAVALFSRGDPLRFFKIIIKASKFLLKPGGILAFEAGLGQAETVSKMMISAGLKELEITKDLAGIDRIIIGRKK